MKIKEGQPLSFQGRVWMWARNCFGEAHCRNVPQRAARFLEEAHELAQAMGMTREQAHRLVEYTWNRPRGEPKQEVGGTLITLAVLCEALGIEMEDAAKVELARCWDNIEKIRAKQAAKPNDDELPGYAVPQLMKHQTQIGLASVNGIKDQGHVILKINGKEQPGMFISDTLTIEVWAPAGSV